MSREICLGIDPGPNRCGWALVEVSGAKPPHFVRGGHDPVETVIAQIEHADRVAVEWIAPGLYDRARHDGLMDTARVEGGLEWLLRANDISFVKVSAGQWRGDVVGIRSASDKDIARVIEQRVTGLASFPAEKKVHVYDAIGVVLGVTGGSRQLRLAMEGARR